MGGGGHRFRDIADPRHLDILEFTVMIQTMNGLGARACSHLLNGTTREKVLCNTRDELAGSEVKLQ